MAGPEGRLERQFAVLVQCKTASRVSTRHSGRAARPPSAISPVPRCCGTIDRSPTCRGDTMSKRARKRRSRKGKAANRGRRPNA